MKQLVTKTLLLCSTMTILGASAFAPSIGLAQNADAQAAFEALPGIPAQDLTTRLANKVFTVKWANGVTSRLDFRSNGYVYMNVGSDSSSRTWRTEDKKLCSSAKGEEICNEMRLDGDQVIMKARSGEIVRLVEN